MIEFLLGKGGKSGIAAQIDNDDSDLLSSSWSTLNSRGKIYARRFRTVNGKQRVLLLHRVIMERILGRELQSDEYVDHIDNNPLNNTRANLRLATIAQNAWNQGKTSRNKSGYKGVYRSGNRWRAYIMCLGKHIHLGMFGTPEEAYAAYCEAALKYHGEYARIEPITIDHNEKKAA